MPEKSAAVSLPPTENTERPHWKRVISSWKTTASANITIGASQSIGMPSGRQPARQPARHVVVLAFGDDERRRRA